MKSSGDEQENSPFLVGYAIRLADAMGECPAGTLGIVYDSDSIGVFVILENGHDFGQFDLDEQTEWLEFVGDTHFSYSFKDVDALMNDYREGVFNPAFEKAKVFAHDLS